MRSSVRTYSMTVYFNRDLVTVVLSCLLFAVITFYAVLPGGCIYCLIWRDVIHLDEVVVFPTDFFGR